MISILVPTRKRPDILERLFCSIVGNTDILYDIEICLYTDDDDDISIPVIQEWSNRINMKVIRKKRHDKNDKTYVMMNELYKICSGEIIMYCPDDMVFKTKSWDTIVKKEFDKVDDKIMLLDGQDGIMLGNVAGAGFVHRNWITAIGYLFTTGYFYHYYHDGWITDVANLSGRRNHMVSLEIEHVHPHDKVVDLDDIPNKLLQDDEYNDLLGKRVEDSNKLIKFISDYKLKFIPSKDAISIYKSGNHSKIIIESIDNFYRNKSYVWIDSVDSTVIKKKTDLILKKIIGFSENSQILDVGSWTGVISNEIVNAGYTNVDCLDICESACKLGKIAFPNLNFYSDSVYSFVPDKKYDIIIMSDILQYLNRPIDVIKHTLDWLNPNGILIIIIPDENCVPEQESVDYISNIERNILLEYSSEMEILSVDSKIWNASVLYKDAFITKNEKSTEKLISLVCIVKNEEDILERMIDSVKDIVDEFVIVDTGSTDSTLNIISKYQKPIEIPFTNYVDTKNEALKKATGKYILFMDADEVLYEGQDKILDIIKNENFDALSCKITEGSRDYNTTTLQYDRIRMWKNNNNWKFVGPGVHEVISGNGKIIFDNDIKIRHDHFDKSSENTNARKFIQWRDLLMNHLEKYPNDSRALFYLARTYKDLSNDLSSIDVYKKYLNITDNNYIDERWQAAYDVASIYMKLGDFKKAFEYCDLAESIDCRRCEHMNLRAEIFYLLHDYDSAIEFYKISSNRPIPGNVSLFLNPFEYVLGKEQLALSYYWNKNYDESEKVYLELLDESPLDQRLLDNIGWCRKKTNMTIFMTLGITPEPIWGGVLNTQGVGGVETAYVELADKLSELGHKVFLFCTTSEMHTYNNVKYIPFEEYSKYSSFTPDIIITSRWLESFDLMESSKKILWLQDASPMGRIYNFEKIDKVIVSSEWHKNYLTIITGGRIPVDKLSIISLGVNKQLFTKDIIRDKNKVLYSSNPNRGLEVLADMWGEITERIPQIKLDVLYGWDGLKTWQGDDEWKKQVEMEHQAILEKFRPYKNVTFVGRLIKEELSKEMLSASLLVYPNTVAETFCLTALEAQVAGMVVITSNFGALQNVVNNVGNIKIDGSPTGEQYRNIFIDSIEKMINNTTQFDLCSSYNRNITISSLNGWDDIAKIWQKTIWEII